MVRDTDKVNRDVFFYTVLHEASRIFSVDPNDVERHSLIFRKQRHLIPHRNIRRAAALEFCWQNRLKHRRMPCPWKEKANGVGQ